MEAKKHMQSVGPGGSNKRQTNILEVIGNAGMGGMESYIKNFIANLPLNEFNITCVCPNESAFTDALRQLGVKDVFITPVEDDPSWRSIQLVSEVAKLHQIDVLHAHMPKAHVLAGIAGCLIHKPVVASVHGMNVTSHELGIARAMGSDLITNCQEAYTQALAMGVPAERVCLVRNGVDVEVFTPGNCGAAFKESIGLSADTQVVGFAGRLDPEKGPDLFVRVAEYIHRLRPDVHFVIAGDGPMLNNLKEMCVQRFLENNVHFIGWLADTWKVYPALDILAHTSRSDGTSLVLLEAMACGCPTVGLAVGGVREIIDNERTGLVAGAGDWEGIGRKIIQLLETPERLKAMGEAARARVKQYFNVKTNTSQTAGLLRQISTGIASQPFTNNRTAPRGVVGRA